MAKFDLKKAILENKATFFSSLTEGQFSWMTQDTGQQIGSQDENMIPVYMFDDKGKYYYENNYDGYGEFGGKDYYDLVAEMNGYTADDAEKFGGTFGELRGIGIKLAFGELEPKNGGPVLFPALVTNPDKFNYKQHNFAVEAETDPNQSWYEPEEDEESDYDSYFGDMDREEDDDEELEEALDWDDEIMGIQKVNRSTTPAPGPRFTPSGYLEDKLGKEKAKKMEDDINELGSEFYEKFRSLSSKQEVDDFVTNFSNPSFNKVKLLDEVKNTTTKMKKSELTAKIREMVLAEANAPINMVTTMDGKTVVGTHQYGVGFKSNEAGKKMGFKDNPTSIPNGTKMSKNESLDEMEIDVQDSAKENSLYDPLAESDFLAEIEGMLNEASEFDTNKPARIAEFLKALDLLVYDEYHSELYDSDEVKQAYDLLVKAAKKLGNLNEAAKDEEVDADVEAADDTTGEDTTAGDETAVDTTVDVSTNEVDPNVKSVQDALTQAQAAAQQLGDPKLTDQIGNTITFFTRSHVVEKPKGAVAENLNESMFPMLKRILK